MMWQLALDAWAFKEETIADQDFKEVLYAFIEEKVEFVIISEFIYFKT